MCGGISVSKLKIDEKMWSTSVAQPVNTLQLFITNRCNVLCKGCFYQDRLGKGDMSYDEYKKYVKNYPEIKKVILLGGEPTLHDDIHSMIKFNQYRGLKTTIYTNGFKIKKFENMNLRNVDIRIGILGLYTGEKMLSKISTAIPITIVYMLRKDNISELMDTANYAEENFDCKGFYISSIRDIAVTHDYWTDTQDTISNEEYAAIVQKFLDTYEGNIKKIHIARRGTIDNEIQDIDKCRFVNIFPNGDKILCPFDISLNKKTEDACFNKYSCDKDKYCILQKIVLEKKY
jgi:MoaA/NifB/PqqE/SkfB family radical SAM enzyme